MVVYILKNNVNGLQYVGATKRTTTNRLYGHRSAARNGSNQPLHRAMREHGVENFSVVSEIEIQQPEALEALEEDLIKRLNTRDPKVGYNVADGGCGFGGGNKNPKRFTRPTMVKLAPEVQSRLERLAHDRGYTVAALVRWCIDSMLPILEKKLPKAD